MLAREGVGVIFEFKVSFEAIGKEKGQERGNTRDRSFFIFISESTERHRD